ncbi:galactosyltransferase-related protein [Paenibacillus sp. M1]|uniref:Galactosyltransferase-related protein n=1 Tax=Paenibacillus haidiansis TaxID=1574488 RepID=A0ABU7VRX2_9BACL
MFRDISVLIPYKPDQGPRDKAFGYVKRFYETYMPAAQLCIGEVDGEPFSRSQAINRAAAKAKGSVFVVVDNDIIYDPALLLRSIELLNEHQWVIPFTTIHRLSKGYSERLVLTGSGQWPLPEKPDTKTAGATYFVGGMNVLLRSSFEQVGGYDERFRGWGGEDEAFAYALDTLIGKHRRLEGELIHFWHPFVGPGGNPHYDDNYLLYRRYKNALSDPAAMLRLIQEKREAK